MTKLINKIPLLRILAQFLYFSFVAKRRAFQGAESYWQTRYLSGGTSGAGAYSKLARFKAEVLNDFVREHAILTVIEYGCGDGNQLQLARYPPISASTSVGRQSPCAGTSSPAMRARRRADA